MPVPGRGIEDLRADGQDVARACEIQAREQVRGVGAAVGEGMQQDSGVRGEGSEKGEGGREARGFGGAGVHGYVCDGGGDEEDAGGGVEGLVAARVFGDVPGGGVEPAGEEDELWGRGGWGG